MTTDSPLPACITRDRLTSPYWPNLSFAGLMAVIVLGLVFMLTSFNRLNHTDLWGHINFGHYIATHRALPSLDPLAAVPSDIPVLHGAWLSQTLGYEVYRLFGNEGLALAHALLVTLTAAIVMLAVYRRGAPPIWSATSGLVMLLLDLPIAGTIRPQLFGQLGAALFLLAAVELPTRKHPVFWLPLVAALWANLHGSVLIGFAILGIHALAATWDAYRSRVEVGKTRRDPGLLLVWAALFLAVAAACLNPHGPALFIKIAGFGKHAALDTISEWRALTPRSLTGVLMIVSMAVTALLIKYSPLKWRAADILLLAIFGLATFPAMRMLAWWAIVWPVVAWPHAAAAWRKFQQQKSAEPLEYRDVPTAMRTVIALGFTFMVILIAPPTFSIVSSRARGEGIILSSDTPLYVAHEMMRRNLSGTIAAPLDWADFLTLKTGGQLKPLVHTHVHLADSTTWQDYEAIFRGDDSWVQKLRQHNMQYVLVPRRRYPTLSKHVLAADRNPLSHLRIIYQDQRCVLAELAL